MANPTNARAAAGDLESSVQRDAMKKRVNAIIPAARPETSNAVKMIILCISATTQTNGLLINTVRTAQKSVRMAHASAKTAQQNA